MFHRGTQINLSAAGAFGRKRPFYFEKSCSSTFLPNTDNVIDIYIPFYATAVLNL